MSELPVLANLTDEERAENSRREREEIASHVDGATRARAGSLAAHSCSDQAVADMLLLSLEQVDAVKETEEYKGKYAEVANEIIQRQIDANEGWDVVEQKAIMQIIQTLEFNRDPKYALFAAKTANSAARRKPTQHNPRVLTVPGAADPANPEAPQAPVINNVINLTINRNYLNAKTAEGGATIDVTPKVEPMQRKVADLPSPASVEFLLSPVKHQKKMVVSEIEQQFINAGVVFDTEDGT